MRCAHLKGFGTFVLGLSLVAGAGQTAADPTFGLAAATPMPGASTDFPYASGQNGLTFGGSPAKAWDASGNVTVLLPPGSGGSGAGTIPPYTYGPSLVAGASGNVAVGFAHAYRADIAMLWTKSGSSWSYQELEYGGGTTPSYAAGIGGTQIVGMLNYQAYAWNNLNPLSRAPINLNPTNLTFAVSDAVATNGSKQVGYGAATVNSAPRHALLWSGTADSAVDLTPTNLTGYSDSVALGISPDGATQVGFADGSATGNHEHAMVWTGNGSTAVDLHPASSSFTDSQATATNGVFTVGVAYNGTTFDSPNAAQVPFGYGGHAMAWLGTTAYDLEGLLPAGHNWFSSNATAIDANNTIYGWAMDQAGNMYAVSWSASPTPEPASLAMIGAGAATLIVRRRRPTSR